MSEPKTSVPPGIGVSGSFTPGPWFAEGDFVYGVEYAQLCCGRGYHSCCGEPEVAESRFQIAQCAPDNAPLIAAAPEMYEALKGLLVGREHVGSPALELARAALSRAEGLKQ
jgi:hypothetical protein